MRTADEATLDTCTDRVLGAASLEDVFSPHKPANPAKGKKQPGSGPERGHHNSRRAMGWRAPESKFGLRAVHVWDPVVASRP